MVHQHHQSHHHDKKEKKISHKISSLLKGRHIASDCATSNYPRVIHTAQTWAFMQLSYKKIIDGNSLGRRLNAAFRQRRSLLGMDSGDNGEDLDGTNNIIQYDSGIDIDYEVKVGPRGRGVFVAMNPVPKGKQVWKAASKYSYATFRKPEDMIDFLELLPHDWQCDILLWAYPNGKKARIDLNEGSYINHADEPRLVNLDDNCYAVRDIAVGEELLMDYSQFIEKLEWFDDLRAYAWNDHSSKKSLGDKEGGNDIGYYTKVGAPQNSGRIGDIGRNASASGITLGTFGEISVILDGNDDTTISYIQLSMFALSLIVSIMMMKAARRFLSAKRKHHAV
jgi:hypothetical protein